MSEMRWLRDAGLLLLASTLLLLLTAASATAQVFGPTGALSNTFLNTDTGSDDSPRLTTDGAGQWVAVWQSADSLSGTIGTDNDILVARSTDNGASWSAPAPLNSNAASDSGQDEKPQVSTDGAGNWVAVWASTDSLGSTIGTDNDVLVSRSTDNGATWSVPVPLNTNAASDLGEDVNPQVSTDSMGNWLAVWSSTDSLGGTIGTDDDILVSRSVDNGLTWSAPAALNSNAAADSGQDLNPQPSTDGAGNWVTVWQSTDSLGGTIGTDNDVLVSRSTDNGSTWSVPAALNSNAASDSGADLNPELTTDAAGNWVAVWQSTDTLGGTIGTDEDILVSRSIDNGATWTAPAPLNAAATDSGRDIAPQVYTDGAGRWLSVWYSSDNLGGTIGTDNDILVARSTNNGATWSAPAALNGNAASDFGNDQLPQVTTDGAGNWVTVWRSTDTLGNTIGSDTDILTARSANNGVTWTAPAALNSNAFAEATDRNPSVSTDGAGSWIAVWHSHDSLGGTIGTDADIFFSRSTDNGTTWSMPVVLNSNAASDSGADENPQVSGDGAGNWVTVWDSRDSLGGTIGTDLDVLVSRSSDNGATWTAPVALNSNAASDTLAAADVYPHLSNGAGVWVAVWVSNNVLGGGGPDAEIHFSRSTNNGATWSAPAVLNSGAASDNALDGDPRISTDGAGNWVSVWWSGGVGDVDILTARSSDNGVTWSANIALNSNAGSDTGQDEGADVTNDGAGNWVAVWESSENLGGTIGTDDDILVSRSSDNGATWSPPAALNSSASSDVGADLLPRVTTDGDGHWMAAWQSNDSLGGTVGFDPDILMSRSTDNGVTWTAVQALNSNAASDTGIDLEVSVSAGAGMWVAVWFSDDALGGPAIPGINDVFYATGVICGDAAVAGAEQCDDGGTMLGDGCDSSCNVEAGYECPIPGQPCNDINGCDPDPCLNGAICSDMPAPGTGAACDCSGTGYSGATCGTDIDECTEGTDNCDVNATCTNEPGSFSCACNIGYDGNGLTCADIDGCNPNPCLNGGVCVDVQAPGVGATCDCGGTGYTGASCDTDVDECALETDTCDTNATCTNTTGTFSCSCNMGYAGDGTTCIRLGSEHYVAYKIKAPRRSALGVEIPGNTFPKDWVITITDTILEALQPGAVDNPENFIVKKEKSLLLPARKNDEAPPDLNGLHYLRYQASSGTQSVQPAVNSSIPRPPRHVSRSWELNNQFGSIKVRSKKVTAILVPANKGLSSAPPAPADATHYVCYQVSAVSGEYTEQTPGTCSGVALMNSGASCLDDSDCGGSGGQFTHCLAPAFRKDSQAFFADQFDDCANNSEGGASFAGAAAEGMCLFDIRKVKELCNPIDKTAVEPPRETTAVITESTAEATLSLLCYQPRLALTVKNATTASLASVPMQPAVNIDDRVDPRQTKHFQRRVKNGNPVSTAPGNLFPAPAIVDTNRQELVCIPSDVLAVSDAAP